MEILRTRLHKPEISDHFVKRSRLFAILNSEKTKHITLVVGASGYGKSITISQWLDQVNSKFCWISLDEELNELRTFLLYIVKGVKSIFPGALERSNEILAAPLLPTEKIIADTLINELDVLDEDLILVLDDYHLIQNQHIHNIINELLKYFPNNCHLVIISRRDPPLHLSMLRTHNRIHEIRMSDLGFDKSETIELAQLTTGQYLSDQLVDVLLEKTEGWIIGLRLALLSVEKNKDLRKAFDELQLDGQQLTNYLMEVVVLNQEEDIRELLLIASIPERFNKELLMEMAEFHLRKVQGTHTEAFDGLFERFQNSALFIISLDNRNEWFRYHHFFRDFLQRELSGIAGRKDARIRVVELHKKASEYFFRKKLFNEAIQHALKAGDNALAIMIVRENKYHLFDSDQFGLLGKWLNTLPVELIENDLSLILGRAILNETIKDFPSMKRDLAIAEKMLPNSARDSALNKQLLGEYYAAACALSFNEGNFEEAYRHSLKALEFLTARSKYLRTFAFANQALASSAMGRGSDVILNISKSLKELSPSDSIGRLHSLVIQSFIHSFNGSLPEIRKSAVEYYRICLENKLWISLTYSTYYLAETSYQWNQLDEAVEFAKALDDHYYSGRPYWVLFTLSTKIFSLQALGKTEELMYAVNEIRAVTKSLNIDALRHFTKAVEVELAMRDNDIIKASELSKSINFEMLNPGVYFYFPQLTLVKVLMADGRPGKMAEAEDRIQKLIELGRSTHKNNLLMQTLLLQSLFFCKKDDHESAFQVAKEAIKLAEQGEFIRIFIDLGKPMMQILEEINRREPGNNYIQKLLFAFKQDKSFSDHIQHLQKGSEQAFKLNSWEELSAREINLLRLISEGYRNKEIAGKLYLSEDSIKKYLSQIYQKLDVHNRVAAILKATELGLISQSGNSRAV